MKWEMHEMDGAAWASSDQLQRATLRTSNDIRLCDTPIWNVAGATPASPPDRPGYFGFTVPTASGSAG
jgi:hypothetical protein